MLGSITGGDSGLLGLISFLFLRRMAGRPVGSAMPTRLSTITTCLKGGPLACSAGGFWRGEWMNISIGCSGRHLEIEKQWRVGARQKVYQVWERERKIGEGRGEGKEKSACPH